MSRVALFFILGLSGLSGLAPTLWAAPSSPNGLSETEGSDATKKLKIDRALLELRDPFARPPAPAIALDHKSDLEKISITDLKMLGVVTGPDRLRAMIAAPNGRTYFVSESMPIGTRKGVIRKITPNSIKIRERIVDVFGDEKNSDTELTLPTLQKKELNGAAGW